jgi:hypothetical protein
LASDSKLFTEARILGNDITEYFGKKPRRCWMHFWPFVFYLILRWMIFGEGIGLKNYWAMEFGLFLLLFAMVMLQTLICPRERSKKTTEGVC